MNLLTTALKDFSDQSKILSLGTEMNLFTTALKDYTDQSKILSFIK